MKTIFLILILGSNILYSDSVYWCSMTSSSENGVSLEVSKDQRKARKLEINTSWYGKPIGLTVYKDAEKEGILRNTQTKLQWLQSDVMIFTYSSATIEIDKGDAPLATIKATENGNKYYATLECIKK